MKKKNGLKIIHTAGYNGARTVPTYFEENEIFAIMEIYVFFTELDKKGLGMRTILSLGEGTPQLTVMIENSIIVILQFAA